jgi:hypothetical protein
MTACELIIAAVCISGGVTSAEIVQRAPTLAATAVVIGVQVGIEQSIVVFEAPSGQFPVKCSEDCASHWQRRCVGTSTAMTCVYRMKGSSARVSATITLQSAPETEIRRAECLVGLVRDAEMVQWLSDDCDN